MKIPVCLRHIQIFQRLKFRDFQQWHYLNFTALPTTHHKGKVFWRGRGGDSNWDCRLEIWAEEDDWGQALGKGQHGKACKLDNGNVSSWCQLMPWQAWSASSYLSLNSKLFFNWIHKSEGGYCLLKNFSLAYLIIWPPSWESFVAPWLPWKLCMGRVDTGHIKSTEKETPDTSWQVGRLSEIKKKNYIAASALCSR